MVLLEIKPWRHLLPIQFLGPTLHQYQYQSLSEGKQCFARISKRKQIGIKTITSDGACLFRSVADQVYGDGGDLSHANLRVKVCGWLEREKKNLENFVCHAENEGIDAHICEMRKPDTYGTNLEVVALSAILLREIHIHAYDYEYPLVMLHESVHHVSGPPLMISRRRDNHYNSLFMQVTPSPSSDTKLRHGDQIPLPLETANGRPIGLVLTSIGKFS